MNKRDREWRQWCDDNIGTTRNEDLLYQCWVAAWKAATKQDVTFDHLMGKTPEITEQG
jgi:hypothetical protein